MRCIIDRVEFGNLISQFGVVVVVAVGLLELLLLLLLVDVISHYGHHVE